MSVNHDHSGVGAGGIWLQNTMGQNGRYILDQNGFSSLHTSLRLLFWHPHDKQTKKGGGEQTGVCPTTSGGGAANSIALSV